MRCRTVLPAAALALLAAAPVPAQSSRCTPVRGDQACAIDGSTRLGGFGPMAEPHALPRPVPTDRAPGHQIYMSPACASLSDGVRTAAARGLGVQAQADLRAGYLAACQDDEALARQRFEQERLRQRSQRADQRAEAEAAVQQEQAQTRQTVAQCGELRRILANRHARIATLSAGELNDLRRFEASFADRCPATPAATSPAP